MAREFAKKFYKSRQWQRAREYVLKRDRYLCVKCGNPAEEVHHKEHLNESNINDPEIALNPDNLQSLCKDCHFREHAQKRDEAVREGYMFDEDGNIVPV